MLVNFDKQYLKNLPEEVALSLEKLVTVTSRKCTQPRAIVIKRSHLASTLGQHWGVEISPKVFNQLVTIASRNLQRQPLTITPAGSRNKYLLAEINKGQRLPPYLLVLDFLWDKPCLFNVALDQYRHMALEGRRYYERQHTQAESYQFS